MSGLFDGTPLERPVTCANCGRTRDQCACRRNAGGHVLLPTAQQARVRREKRRGKFVTVIHGLDPRASDLASLLKHFQTTLGTGGTVADGEIVLQGDHREKVLAHLRSLGYPAKASGG